MSGDYAMPLHTGSKLLKRVAETQSTYFNRRIHAHLDMLKPMEKKIQVQGPSSSKNDAKYSTYGPMGIMGLSKPTMVHYIPKKIGLHCPFLYLKAI